MEYSLQIDLAICLNTEYVWTKRTKKSKVDLSAFGFLLCYDGVRSTPYTKTDAPPRFGHSFSLTLSSTFSSSLFLSELLLITDVISSVIFRIFNNFSNKSL